LRVNQVYQYTNYSNIYPAPKTTGNKNANYLSLNSRYNNIDVFEKSKPQQVSFQGKNHLSEYIIKFLKNRSYERSIKGSKRPYLSVVPELENIIKPVEIKIGKKECINAFDMNPKNSNKYVIFLHGFSQNITNNQPLYKSLLKSNYGVLAIDYRGYGHNKASSHINETDVMNDVTTAAKYLNAKGINNIGLIGHSFGGYIAAKTSNLHNFNFQILVSPMLSLEFCLRNIKRYPGKYKLEEALIKYIPGFKDKYPQIFEIKKHLTSNTTPTYIVHSKTDGYMPYKEVDELFENAHNPKDYILLQRGGHRMDDSKIESITDILMKL